MLTPRAIMVGQYRSVLAVSTGIRAQDRVLWPGTLQTGQNRANLPRRRNGTWNNGKSVGSLMGVVFQYVIIEGTDTHLSLRGHLGVRGH